MLSITEASVRYGAQTALQGVTLGLEAGQVLAVLGPSGCGKSTLLRAVAGLEPLTAGDIAFDGASLAGVPTHRRGFALMFQDGQLFEHQSVAGNVGYPLKIRRIAQRAARVAELLDLVGLAGYADRRPATLSGGERQRVALARALAVEPRLLLLDEPLSALDRTLRERLATDLRTILKAAGTTALLVTHDHDEAFAIADRLAVLRAGELVQHGTLAQVWEHPADPETARFLGYPAVVAGAAAARFAKLAGRPVAPRLALRRSALVLDPTGPLTGVVQVALLTPEVVRLRVELPDLGEFDAVAPTGGAVPAAGASVRLRVDPERIAAVGP